MSTPAQLLVRTDQLARDLLVDPDHSAGLGPYSSWQEMINAAADAWRSADHHPMTSPAPDPLLAIQSMINNSAPPNPQRSGTDPRLAALSIQLRRLTTHYRFIPEQPDTASAARTLRAQGSVLHASYLVTHAAGLALRREHGATKKPTLLAEISRARETVEIAEHMLDVHLHHRLAGSPADQQLDTALTRWTATAHQVLSEQPPEPKNNYIISDVQHGLLAHTAAFLRAPAPQTSQTGAGKLIEQRERVLPALVRSADHWRQVRQAWAGLAAPTTGISRELADAARLLHHSLRDPTLDRDARAVHLLGGALGAAVGTARGLADAFDSDRLRAPTDVVVALTRDVLDRTPEVDAYQVWMGMNRHTGRAPIALPDPLRQELTRQAHRNVEAAAALRSASHGLLETGTHIPPTVHRGRSPGVHATNRAVTTRPRDTVGPRR